MRRLPPSLPSSKGVVPGRLLAAALAALAVLGAVGPSAAQSPGEPVPPPPELALDPGDQFWLPADAFPTGTFWRIERRGELRGYVLGTLHIGEPGELGVPEEAFRRLADARSLVVEIAPSGYSPERAEALRSLPKGSELRTLLGETSYALAERVATEAKLDAAALARMQPWAALALLQAASHLPRQSLDDLLIARAQALGLEVVGLETLEEQFGAFACVPPEGQALVMDETLAVHDRFREFNDVTLKLYREQDLRGLMAYLTTSVPLSPGAKVVDAEMTRCVIDVRNRLMAERLEPLLESRLPFVAIGALHLTGRDGVLGALVRRGYRFVPATVETPSEVNGSTGQND